MRILFGSDFHGLEEAYERFAEILAKPCYDVGVISGDLTSLASDSSGQERSLKEILWKGVKPVLVGHG